MARPRRALHRAFARWLEANGPRFAVPLRFTKRTDPVWSFAFEGVTNVLSGWINTFEVTVAAEWDDGAWDLILDLDASPVPVSGGFVCRICAPDKRALFASREALWADHLFEPLLVWVNDTLAVRPWLKLTGTADMSMSAQLRAEAGVAKAGNVDQCPVRYVSVRGDALSTTLLVDRARADVAPKAETSHAPLNRNVPNTVPDLELFPSGLSRRYW